MEKDVLSVFLPELLVSCFDIVELKKLCNISSKKEEYYIHLNEKNTLPEEIISSDYESKGFLPSSTIQDFPIRGKAVYLVIKRRRWRNKYEVTLYIVSIFHTLVLQSEECDLEN